MSSSNFAFFLRNFDDFFPDFAPNSRKEWGLSLFNQSCENESENYRNFWKFWKSFKFIQFYSIVSLVGIREPAPLQEPSRPKQMVISNDITLCYTVIRNGANGTSLPSGGRHRELAAGADPRQPARQLPLQLTTWKTWEHMKYWREIFIT